MAQWRNGAFRNALRLSINISRYSRYRIYGPCWDQGKIDHISDMTIYPIYLLTKIPSHMSECWPYNRFDHISDDHITDIYCKCFWSSYLNFDKLLYENKDWPLKRSRWEGSNGMLSWPKYRASFFLLTFVLSFDLMTKQTTCENGGWMKHTLREIVWVTCSFVSCVWNTFNDFVWKWVQLNSLTVTQYKAMWLQWQLIDFPTGLLYSK